MEKHQNMLKVVFRNKGFKHFQMKVSGIYILMVLLVRKVSEQEFGSSYQISLVNYIISSYILNTQIIL